MRKKAALTRTKLEKIRNHPAEYYYYYLKVVEKKFGYMNRLLYVIILHLVRYILLS